MSKGSPGLAAPLLEIVGSVRRGEVGRGAGNPGATGDRGMAQEVQADPRHEARQRKPERRGLFTVDTDNSGVFPHGVPRLCVSRRRREKG